VPPAAIEKADSLAAFAKRRGAPLKDFKLALTAAEAFELLDFIAAGGMGVYANHHLLIQDVQNAHAAGEPWELVSHFELCGLKIDRADLVLN
jgi:hypothetical protein